MGARSRAPRHKYKIDTATDTKNRQHRQGTLPPQQPSATSITETPVGRRTHHKKITATPHPRAALPNLARALYKSEVGTDGKRTKPERTTKERNATEAKMDVHVVDGELRT